MTAQWLAALHARCFSDAPRPWNVAEFTDFLASDLDHVLLDPDALGVVRVVGDEAELLTICVDPRAQSAGRGRAMLNRLIAEAQARGAAAMFLEVAADNAAALALYNAAGFVQTGRRVGYYRRGGGVVDALVMVRALPLQQG